jgi:bacillithiol biosynthesis deacetylase BshB1
MKLDILVLAAHPDDAELGCSGTIIAHIAMGKKVGILDLTKGELGTRGTAETRRAEAEDASRILGLSVRENMGFADGFFISDEKHQRALIRMIRRYQPDIVLANAIEDRHPDHGKGAQLATDACFLSGLRKIETIDNGIVQEAWRPKVVYHYIQDRYIKPDFVVDISAFWDKKVEAIRAYKTQFFNQDLNEPQTYISSPEFLNFIEARAAELGHQIGVRYGEGFTKEKVLGVKSLYDLI